jgi:hypothetical protein
MGPAVIVVSPDFVIVARDRQNPFAHSLECCAPFAMTSSMHAPASPDIEAAPADLPLASCGFARHANIARVCGTPCGRSGSPGPSVQDFAMAYHRKPIWALYRICYVLSVLIDAGQQIFTEGKNRRRSMPESSLAEEAAIPPAGNVLAVRIPAGRTSGVNGTGVPDRRGGQPPAWGMTTDANGCVGDDPVFSARPGLRSSQNCPPDEIHQRSSAAAGRSSRAPDAGLTQSPGGARTSLSLSNISPPRQQAPFPEG